MRLYKDYPYASISMGRDPEIKNIIQEIIYKEKIKYVIESGTFQGLGSTKMIAECFTEQSTPEQFVTIEVNWNFWKQARENLSKYPFVTCLWGRSVNLNKALKFIKKDDYIINHGKYPEIFIDDIIDPLRFYTDELLGNLGSKKIDNFEQYNYDKKNHYQGENLLKKYLSKFRKNNPLIILDSAGGIGFLEFQILLKTMKKSSYIVLLDDVLHIKHHRSLLHIQESSDFMIVEFNKKHGWLLAKHL